MPRLETLFICLGASLVALALGALFFAWSGVYNVAASHGHHPTTTWALNFGLRRSVETHSLSVSRPDRLEDRDLATLGAGHYAGGCAFCHGAPGQRENPVVQQMLPEPPDLTRAAERWSPEELFWIAKHGLKYTGMPAWVAQERDDEVWAIVAFLLALPKMSATDFETIARGNVPPLRRDGREIAELGVGAKALTACARCHGLGRLAPTSRLIPKLAAQSRDYLKLALRYYANGLRPSGVMQPIAAVLDDQAIERLTTYYASLPALDDKPSAPAATLDRIERGKRIAESGIPEKGAPPCLVCHAGEKAPSFPRLDGQFAPYISEQLRLFRRGVRDRTVQGAIMSVVARRLDDEQIADVAAYFESVAPPPAPTAAPGVSGRKRR
jgi:cytochrome c553